MRLVCSARARVTSARHVHRRRRHDPEDRGRDFTAGDGLRLRATAAWPDVGTCERLRADSRRQVRVEAGIALFASERGCFIQTGDCCSVFRLKPREAIAVAVLAAILPLTLLADRFISNAREPVAIVAADVSADGRQVRVGVNTL